MRSIVRRNPGKGQGTLLPKWTSIRLLWRLTIKAEFAETAPHPTLSP